MTLLFAQMSVAGPTKRKPCILIAEDEPDLLKLMIETLTRDGFSVLGADNGEIALSIARKQRGAIDLLITDIQMPTLDGFDLQERLRQEWPECRLLVVSGALPRSVRGVDFPLLRKPFLPSELTAKVRTLLAETSHDLS